MSTFVSLAVVGVLVAVAYYRFRDNFFDLASATDSKRRKSFWVVVALIYAIVLVALGYKYYRY